MISLVQWGRSSVDIQDRRVRRHQQGHKFNINSTEHTHTHDRRRIAHIRTQTNLISFLATAKRTRVMSTLSLTLAPIDLIHTYTDGILEKGVTNKIKSSTPFQFAPWDGRSRLICRAAAWLCLRGQKILPHVNNNCWSFNIPGQIYLQRSRIFDCICLFSAMADYSLRAHSKALAQPWRTRRPWHWSPIGLRMIMSGNGRWAFRWPLSHLARWSRRHWAGSSFSTLVMRRHSFFCHFAVWLTPF